MSADNELIELLAEARILLDLGRPIDIRRVIDGALPLALEAREMLENAMSEVLELEADIRELREEEDEEAQARRSNDAAEASL